MPQKRKIFYGWWLVLATAAMNVFAGGLFYYGFTVFFNPIKNTFGWTAAGTSVAFVLQRLEGGVLGPVVGFLVDKVGPRKLMLPGWTVAGLGFFMMSQINSMGAFYVSFLVTAAGFSFGTFVVTNAVIANWFDRKRSRAMTLMYVGFGISGTLVPLLSLLISHFGWRMSLTLAGIILWVLGLPLSGLMRHRPEQYGYRRDGASGATGDEPANTANGDVSRIAREPSPGSSEMGHTVKAALRTRAFWLLTFAFLFQQIGMSAVMVHIVPFLESVEVSRGVAATAVMGLTISSLIGRIGFGLLGDFTNKRYLIAIAFTFQTIGIFIFSLITSDRTWLIILFLLTYGPGYGGAIPLRPALQADYFGTKSFGTIMGLMMVVSMLGGLTSPVIAGWLFDTTGSYRLAWQIFAIISVPAMPVMLLAKPPVARPENHLT